MAEPFYIIDNAKFEMVNSKYAMTTICNILMNLVVLENKVVEEAHIFYHLLKFIMNTLPSLENNGEVRQLKTCLLLTRNTSGAGAVRQSGSVGTVDTTETLQATQVYGLFYIPVYPGKTCNPVIRVLTLLSRLWSGSSGTPTTARRPGRRRNSWSQLLTLNIGMI